MLIYLTRRESHKQIIVPGALLIASTSCQECTNANMSQSNTNFGLCKLTIWLYTVK